MAYLLIPETILYNIVNGAIAYIGQDIDNNATEDQLLYKMLNGIRLGKFDFYGEAVNVFSRKNNHPRRIETRLFFDSSRAHMPTVHLNLPSESQGDGGIGIDAGYVDPMFDDTEGTYNEIFTRAFDTRYNFLITSDNTFEVVMIYNVLKGMLVGFMETLEFEGIRNPRVSGQDLSVKSELVPENVFMRSITLDFMYEASVPKLQKQQAINSIEFSQTIIGENDG